MVNELPHLHLVARVNNQMEWPIDRKVLLGLAPDRAVLVLSTPTIGEIREKVVIHVDPSDSGHWLNFKRVRRNKAIKEKTARLSRPRSFSMNDMKSDQLPNILAQLQIPTLPTMPQRIPLGSSSITNMNNSNLSPFTNGKSNFSSASLVSPRPLSPTHMLVIYNEAPSPQGVYKLYIECPVNDLVFAVHCPNLNIPVNSGRPFPHHLDDTRENLTHSFVLPKVLIRARIPEVFVELVVYMHTKNQAALFRNILPAWMPDVLHPLYVNVNVLTPPQSPVLHPVGKSSHSHAHKGANLNWLTRVIPHPHILHDKDDFAQPSLSLDDDAATLAVYDRVAHDLAERSSFDGELERTKVLLDALQESLVDLGLSDPSVEREVQRISLAFEKAILVRAKQEPEIVN